VNSPPPSVCYYDNRFNVKVIDIIAGCDTVTFKFQIYPYYTYYDQGIYNSFLQSYTLNGSASLSSYSRSGDIISYYFSFNKTIQDANVQFIFDPSALQLIQTSQYPVNIINFQVIPTNNVLAIYY
jgi:hypothetical protein